MPTLFLRFLLCSHDAYSVSTMHTCHYDAYSVATIPTISSKCSLCPYDVYCILMILCPYQPYCIFTNPTLSLGCLLRHHDAYSAPTMLTNYYNSYCVLTIPTLSLRYLIFSWCQLWYYGDYCLPTKQIQRNFFCLCNVGTANIYNWRITDRRLETRNDTKRNTTF